MAKPDFWDPFIGLTSSPRQQCEAGEIFVEPKVDGIIRLAKFTGCVPTDFFVNKCLIISFFPKMRYFSNASL
jgi:hypothetical protein